MRSLLILPIQIFIFTLLCHASGFMKALKNFIKYFETAWGNVKTIATFYEMLLFLLKQLFEMHRVDSVKINETKMMPSCLNDKFLDYTLRLQGK